MNKGADFILAGTDGGGGEVREGWKGGDLVGSSAGRLSSLQLQSGRWLEPPGGSESRRYFIKRPTWRWDGLIYSHQVQPFAPPPPVVCEQRGAGKGAGDAPTRKLDRQKEIEKKF